MHVRIHHSTVYRYVPPVAGAIQLLRLTPRDFDGQHVVRWRIELSADARLTPHEDAFGNITHVFTATGPLDELRVDVDGEVETQNTNGVISGAVERFPPRLFLRPTRLTVADEAIRDFAERARAGCEGDALAQAHALLEGLHREVAFDLDMTEVAPSASEAFALKRGVCRDHCHIFLAAAHHLDIPARYIAGYLQNGRWPSRAGGRPCLGRSFHPPYRLDWVRPGQWPLSDRALCTCRRRARFNRRCAGTRCELRRQQRKP